MDNLKALLPCPFCGSRSVGYSEAFHHVRCNECYARTDIGTEDACTRDWNRRASAPAQATVRLCRDDGKPCPPAVAGKGRGNSRCEQNGVCQRVDMNNLPRLTFSAPGETLSKALADPARAAGTPLTNARSFRAITGMPGKEEIVPADFARSLERRCVELEAGLQLADKARIELAALVEKPDDPDFSLAMPNVADRTCVHKAYIDLQYAARALLRSKP